MKQRILLVEDDTNLAFIVSDQLKLQGYEVTVCNNGAEGLKKFTENNFNLCILDVMMPKKDGFSLASDIRKMNATVPILFLTAKSATEDKIKGFESGGDDYLTKPFSSEEFLLRVKALLRRSNQEIAETQGVINIGIFTFDLNSYMLTARGVEKKLTRKEADILSLLYKYKNQVLPREILLHGVWGQSDYFVGRSLDVFITKLRKYFEADNSIQIINLHGVGFKLEVR